MPICSRCGKNKNEEDFISESGKILKNCPSCREYCKNYSKEYAIKNKEKIKEWNKTSVKLKIWKKEYWAKNKKELSEKNKKWREEHVEERKQYRKEYNLRTREKRNEQHRLWAKKNRSKVKEVIDKWRKENSERFKETAKNRMSSPCMYDMYHKELTIDDKPQKSNEGFLLVQCKKCGRTFMPSRTSVQVRLAALSGRSGGEGSFYCSDECKRGCPMYGRSSDSFLVGTGRDRTQKWADMIKERDGYTCQKCGSKEELVAHHILPVASYPDKARNIDNGVTLCSKCHKEIHKIPWCTINYIKSNKGEK